MTEGRVSLCPAAIRNAWTGVPVGGCCLTRGRTWESHLPCRCWSHPFTCVRPSTGLQEDSHTWASHLGTWGSSPSAGAPGGSGRGTPVPRHLLFFLRPFCCCHSVPQSCWTLVHLRPHGLQPVQLLCPWDSPGKNTGVGCRFLLQGIFPTQGWNLHLLHWQVGSLPRAPPGNPYPSCFVLNPCAVW